MMRALVSRWREMSRSDRGWSPQKDYYFHIMKFLLLFLLLPVSCFSQRQAHQELGLLLNPRARAQGFIVLDSFQVLTNADRPPRFTIELDSLAKRIGYPQMELDNNIEADVYGIFRVNNTGAVDSAWLSHKTYPGIDRAILRFLKGMPLMVPARNNNQNIAAVCQLLFHFRVKR
jgi:hypothetical protein